MATSFREAATAMPIMSDQRSVMRHPVLIARTTIRSHGKRARKAELCDVSIYGARMAVEDEYSVGDRIWVRIDGGMPAAATVAWRDGQRIGCRFDAPLDRALVRALTLMAG